MLVLYVLLAIIFLFVLYQVYELNTLSYSEYEIKSKKIKEEFNNYKIIQISDLHSKQFGKNNKRLINKIDLVKPNAVFLTGDIIDRGDRDFSKTIEFIKNIASKYPVYYIFGNHELEINYSRLKKYNEILKNKNIHIINGEKEKIVLGKSCINICGFQFKHNFNNRKEKYIKFLNDKFNLKDEKEFTVLLTHDPKDIQEYSKLNLDLVFAGHVHGGIVRFGKLSLLSPLHEFFPKYFAGLYFVKNTKMIVSRGLGKSKALVRINNLPDIVCVTLKSDNITYNK